MFQDYLYISSASDTLKTHLFELSDLVVERQQLGSRDLVVDIGCNDGTLLSGFKRHNTRILGIDPAENLDELTKNEGIPRFVGYFNLQSAQSIVAQWGQASVIVSTNSFPHIQNLSEFTKALKFLLAPGGTFVIEMHYLVDLLDQVAFDTIYHEHVSYWRLGPMAHLFASHDLQVVHVERVPLHHGQLRVFVQRQEEGRPEKSVEDILAFEKEIGMDRFETFCTFTEKIQTIKTELHSLIRSLLNQKKRLVAYGAPAKGNTLLTFLEIGPDLIEYIADRNQLKQGRFTPGTHIPVVPPDRLIMDQPDYVLLLAWNFKEEIMGQQKSYLNNGGKFILPLPTVNILK